MPDWKKKEEYDFTQSLDRSGWAWEFMRRNKLYKSDWEEASAGGVVYQPPKNEGETDQVWMVRVSLSGHHPMKVVKTTTFARKWRMRPPILNPYASNAPKFDIAYPKIVGYEEMREYFEDEEPFLPLRNFAVLVFDLTREMSAQLAYANARLHEASKELKKIEIFKPKNILPGKWKNCLRLLDAEMANATSKEIRSVIKQYHPASENPLDKKTAADKFHDHRKTARFLRDHPLLILD